MPSAGTDGGFGNNVNVVVGLTELWRSLSIKSHAAAGKEE
jgi:hypothetical protein